MNRPKLLSERFRDKEITLDEYRKLFDEEIKVAKAARERKEAIFDYILENGSYQLLEQIADMERLYDESI
jgi:hypothetical protein